MAIKIRDDFVRMNRQFGGGFHAVVLQKNVGQQIADPGISGAGKRADKIQLPSLPQEPHNFGGVVRLNGQAEKRAWPLAQQPGEMPEIARPEKEPQGGAKPSLEKSRNGQHSRGSWRRNPVGLSYFTSLAHQIRNVSHGKYIVKEALVRIHPSPRNHQ